MGSSAGGNRLPAAWDADTPLWHIRSGWEDLERDGEPVSGRLQVLDQRGHDELGTKLLST